MKIDESKAREDKLKESLVNTTEHVDKLETLVSELNSTKSERDITPELQEIQKYVADMDELFTPPGERLLLSVFLVSAQLVFEM